MRRCRSAAVAVAATMLVVAIAAGCGSSDDSAAADTEAPADATSRTPESTTSVTSSTSSTAATPPPAPSTEATVDKPAPAPPTTVSPARPLAAAPATTQPPPPPPPAGPPYASSIAVIDDAIRARMSHSWRPGCPVPLEDLRLVTVRHWNDAGAAVMGELVVHADVAPAIAKVFGDLYAAGFPIARVQLIDAYGGDDGASMRANNTSAFNCRTVANTSTWSQHSYGRAVDINPLVNPWVSGGTVDPPEGRPYADRRNQVPGGIYAGDAVVQAFGSIGWKWGGYWSSTKDYQHFSANGR